MPERGTVITSEHIRRMLTLAHQRLATHVQSYNEIKTYFESGGLGSPSQAAHVVGSLPEQIESAKAAIESLETKLQNTNTQEHE